MSLIQKSLNLTPKEIKLFPCRKIGIALLKKHISIIILSLAIKA